MCPQKHGGGPGTYVVVAHAVHVVLQMTPPVVGQDNAAQFAIASKVETSIGGKDEQPSHIPPPDLLLDR